MTESSAMNEGTKGTEPTPQFQMRCGPSFEDDTPSSTNEQQKIEGEKGLEGTEKEEEHDSLQVYRDKCASGEATTPQFAPATKLSDYMGKLSNGNIENIEYPTTKTANPATKIDPSQEKTMKMSAEKQTVTGNYAPPSLNNEQKGFEIGAQKPASEGDLKSPPDLKTLAREVLDSEARLAKEMEIRELASAIKGMKDDRAQRQITLGKLAEAFAKVDVKDMASLAKALTTQDADSNLPKWTVESTPDGLTMTFDKPPARPNAAMRSYLVVHSSDNGVKVEQKRFLGSESAIAPRK